MKIRKNREENGVHIGLNHRRMEEVETYRYLKVDISSNGGMSEQVNHRITEENKTREALKDAWKKKHIS